jgi:heme/copper-type cytochrome/quinol oxidase subunit 4
MTRSLLSLLHGNIQEALWINPLGLVAAILLTVLPAWVLYDGVQRKRTLPRAYHWAELQLQQQKLLYIPLIALVLVNWGWNILKDL